MIGSCQKQKTSLVLNRERKAKEKKRKTFDKIYKWCADRKAKRENKRCQVGNSKNVIPLNRKDK